jgi:hypothetical protein
MYYEDEPIVNMSNVSFKYYMRDYLNIDPYDECPCLHGNVQVGVLRDRLESADTVLKSADPSFSINWKRYTMELLLFIVNKNLDNDEVIGWS